MEFATAADSQLEWGLVKPLFAERLEFVPGVLVVLSMLR